MPGACPSALCPMCANTSRNYIAAQSVADCASNLSQVGVIGDQQTAVMSVTTGDLEA